MKVTAGLDRRLISDDSPLRAEMRDAVFVVKAGVFVSRYPQCALEASVCLRWVMHMLRQWTGQVRSTKWIVLQRGTRLCVPLLDWYEPKATSYSSTSHTVALFRRVRYWTLSARHKSIKAIANAGWTPRTCSCDTCCLHATSICGVTINTARTAAS